MAAGLARASAVVVTYLDVPGPEGAGQCARTRPGAGGGAHPGRHDLEKLQAAGATEVVPEAIEGSLMLASHALALVGVPMRRVIRVVQDQRDARYGLLRGYFHGADDDTGWSATRSACTPSPCPRPPGRPPAGPPGLQAMGVRVSLRRHGGSWRDRGRHGPAAGRHAGAVGPPEPLALAEEKLLRG
jgi:CPA2 family monovalent cation:H+ antiporter-2